MPITFLSLCLLCSVMSDDSSGPRHRKGAAAITACGSCFGLDPRPRELRIIDGPFPSLAESGGTVGLVVDVTRCDVAAAEPSARGELRTPPTGATGCQLSCILPPSWRGRLVGGGCCCYCIFSFCRRDLFSGLYDFLGFFARAGWGECPDPRHLLDSRLTQEKNGVRRADRFAKADTGRSLSAVQCSRAPARATAGMVFPPDHVNPALSVYVASAPYDLTSLFRWENDWHGRNGLF